MVLKPEVQNDEHFGAGSIDEPSAAAQDAEYKVGPGRPPKEHQFKKGQSGNPKGAKRKPASLASDVRQLFEQALGKKITITQAGKKRTLSMLAAGIEQLVNQFVKGDRHARNELFKLMKQFSFDPFVAHKQPDPVQVANPPKKDEQDLTVEEIRSLTTEQLKLIIAAHEVTEEIISQRPKS